MQMQRWVIDINSLLVAEIHMASFHAASDEQLGFAIAQVEGAIKRINETEYVVKSQNGNGDYEVRSTDLD
jgi:hypothetical protein